MLSSFELCVNIRITLLPVCLEIWQRGAAVIDTSRILKADILGYISDFVNLQGSMTWTRFTRCVKSASQQILTSSCPHGKEKKTYMNFPLPTKCLCFIWIVCLLKLICLILWFTHESGHFHIFLIQHNYKNYVHIVYKECVCQIMFSIYVQCNVCTF